jgi:hypothetical protein
MKISFVCQPDLAGFGRNMIFHNKSDDLMIFAGDALSVLRIKNVTLTWKI